MQSFVRIRGIVYWCLFLLGTALPLQAASQPETTRITQEELLPLLDSSELILIDIRTNEQWQESDTKLPGAVHELPFMAKKWGPKYPTDKTIVTYCA